MASEKERHSTKRHYDVLTGHKPILPVLASQILWLGDGAITAIVSVRSLSLHLD